MDGGGNKGTSLLLLAHHTTRGKESEAQAGWACEAFSRPAEIVSLGVGQHLLRARTTHTHNTHTTLALTSISFNVIFLGHALCSTSAPSAPPAKRRSASVTTRTRREVPRMVVTAAVAAVVDARLVRRRRTLGLFPLLNTGCSAH